MIHLTYWNFTPDYLLEPPQPSDFSKHTNSPNLSQLYIELEYDVVVAESHLLHISWVTTLIIA